MIYIESLTVFLSILGVILNIRHDKRCFVIWLCSNVTWAGVDIYHEVYSQALLQALYAGLSVWGIWSWRKQKEGKQHDAAS